MTYIIPQKAPTPKSLVYKWRSRTLYTGPSQASRKRQYFCHALLIGFDGPFTIKDLETGQSAQTRIALLPIASQFVMSSKAQCFAVAFLDQHGLDFKLLKGLTNRKCGRIHHGFDPAWANIVCRKVKRIYENEADLIEAGELWDILKVERRSELYDLKMPLAGIDPRICKVIDMYLDGNLSITCNVEEVAKAASLSQSHLNKLFRENLDTNFRTFRAQLQYHCYIIARSFGKNQSEAALEAGYFDQAHCCKRFKQSSGLKSKDFFSTQIRRKYITDPEVFRRYQDKTALFGALVDNDI